MIKENYVIKKEIKFDMLFKTLPELEKILKHNNDKFFKGKDSHFKDALNSVKYIKNNKSARYHDAFFIMFALTSNFLDIKNKVEKKELNFSHLIEEKFWDNGNIDLNSSIFFSYTFFNELYKDELEIDFKNLESLTEIKEYIPLRDNILKKSLEH
jgi:hypothetical protein